ncbi:MAG: hypothetical protein NTV54_02315 [Ignavibacteriales bacterium]|nr:hypothetical protein [Ignavibacteriales bacterium]
MVMILKRNTRHLPFLSSVLTLCYFLTGIGGQLIALDRIVNVGTSHHKIATEKPSRPIDSRPYWTSYKHIPAPERSLSPAVIQPFSDHCTPITRIEHIAACGSIPFPASAFDNARTSRAPPCTPSHS